MIRAALLVLLLAGCTAAPPLAASPKLAASPADAPPQRWTAVLVAGDDSIPVFDNATQQLASLLEAVGTPPADIRRFSVAPTILAQPRVQLATKARVLAAIEGLQPRPGEACFVFMTSHGAHGPGLYLAPRRDFLSPGELDAALDTGCAGAPTVAIVSGCYTGEFAQPPMARPNRIVLTASSADRPSFGCGAGQVLTFYDDCLLRSLGSLPRDWSEVIADTGRCVAAIEARDRERPSDPQSAIGPGAAKLPVPG